MKNTLQSRGLWTAILQCIGISVGLGLLIDFSHHFLLRTVGLVLLVVCLDWRYEL